MVNFTFITGLAASGGITGEVHLCTISVMQSGSKFGEVLVTSLCKLPDSRAVGYKGRP